MKYIILIPLLLSGCTNCWNGNQNVHVNGPSKVDAKLVKPVSKPSCKPVCKSTNKVVSDWVLESKTVQVVSSSPVLF